MPYPRHFFRSPSLNSFTLQQATIGTSVYTRLYIRPLRPSPTPCSLEQHQIKRQQIEPTGSRRMAGEPNDIVVTEMFRSYQHNFSLNNLNIIRDNNKEIYRWCSYTREHKLAAIDIATTSWSCRSNGLLKHVSWYYVLKRLRISVTNLGRWIKNKHRILALKKGF
jgi:hypothetical protein